MNCTRGEVRLIGGFHQRASSHSSECGQANGLFERFPTARGGRQSSFGSATDERGQHRDMTRDNSTQSAHPWLPADYQVIYEIIDEGGIGCHLTAREIHARVLERWSGIGFPTVCLGLEHLRALGLVCKLYVPDVDAATYEPSRPRHAGFRCSECGQIGDLTYAIPRSTIEELASRHGFAIESQRVTFEGRCVACVDKMRAMAASDRTRFIAKR